MGEAPEAVPDLRDQLRSNGLYQEYMAYRAQCHRFRAQRDQRERLEAPMTFDLSAGQSRGAAQQKLTSFSELPRRRKAEADPSHFEEYYPTHRKFMWHHTASYWTAVLFVQGSLFFVFAGGVDLAELTTRIHWSRQGVRAFTLWPNFVGGMMYLLGAYCGYLNLINLKKEASEPIEYFLTDWNRVRANCPDFTSRLGTMSFLIGAGIFTSGVVFPFFDLPMWLSYLLITVPGFVGSIFFVMGSVCELLHNGILCGCRPAGGAVEAHQRSGPGDVVWWIAVFNMIGSVNFLLGYSPGIFFVHGRHARFFEQVNFFAGSIFYACSSWLLVLMWKAHDFGLALLRQLNEAIGSGTAVARRRRADDRQIVHIELQRQASSSASAEPGASRISLRGACFIGVYCWLSFVAGINTICLVLWDWHTYKARRHLFRDFSACSAQVLLVLGTMLVIGLHSTVTSVPKVQPYRSLLLLTRLLLTLGAITQTFCFVDFFMVPYDDARPLPDMLKASGGAPILVV